MKGCVVLQGNYAKLGHSIAYQLKYKYGVDDFCAYVISKRAKTFVGSQTDLIYTGILIDEEMQNKYHREKVDIDYIKTIEKKYGIPNLWPLIYSDRTIMMSMTGSDRPMTPIMNPLFTHEEIIKIVQIKAKETIDFLNKEKPDFILFFSIGLIGHMLLYHIAKKMGIKVFSTEWLRLGNKMTLTEDYNTITGIKEIFQKNKIENQSTSYQEAAKKIIEKFTEHKSLDIGFVSYDQNVKVALIKRLRVYKEIIMSYIRESGLAIDKYNKPTPPWIWFKMKCLLKIRKFIGYRDIYYKPDWQENYAFYPLHYEPETSILNIAVFASNQVTVIENIAKSLPLHFKLYVKEHPSMIGYREKNYYKKLLKIPNVVLVDTALPSFEIIKHAKLVTVISGTAGWEACLAGKPVITFGRVFFNDAPSVKHCQSMQELPYLIEESLRDTQPNKKEMVNFVSAMLENGYVETEFFNYEHETYDQLKNAPATITFCQYIAKKLSL